MNNSYIYNPVHTSGVQGNLRGPLGLTRSRVPGNTRKCVNPMPETVCTEARGCGGLHQHVAEQNEGEAKLEWPRCSQMVGHRGLLPGDQTLIL